MLGRLSSSSFLSLDRRASSLLTYDSGRMEYKDRLRGRSPRWNGGDSAVRVAPAKRARRAVDPARSQLTRTGRPSEPLSIGYRAKLTSRIADATVSSSQLLDFPTTDGKAPPHHVWLSDERVRLGARRGPAPRRRSEEHTSELQSRGHLVCRLLLEKK